MLLAARPTTIVRSMEGSLCPFGDVDQTMGTRFVRSTVQVSRWIRVLAGLAAAIAIIILAARPLRDASRRAGSATNLRQIGAAMRVYHDTYRHFPADIRSKDGEALLSWRVRILPLIGQGPLFQEFHLDERWDSPRNRALHERMPAVSSIPAASPRRG
jgi:Protein of unknown function (DUF1559)